MSEPRSGGRWARLRGVLAGVAHALDVLPDGLAMGLGLVLGGAVAVAAVRGDWLWAGLVAVGLAFALGRNVGARPRREGLVLPVMGAMMVAGLAAVLVGVTWPEGGAKVGGPWVVTDREDFLRVDLGGGETGEGASSTGGSSDGTSSGSDGATQTDGSTSGTDSTSTRKDDRTTGPDSVCGSDVFIKGGAFAGHVIKDLCMDETEVTVEQYQRCVDQGRCTEADTGGYCNAGKDDRGRHPINCVDWEQAREFCEWKSKRLPDQWEWEWAARGRDEGRIYPWGDSPEPTCARVVMSNQGIDGCGKDRTWAVGSKQKGNSRDGLEDMVGNVWEWTSSTGGSLQSIRGGSWISADSEYFRIPTRHNVQNAVNRPSFVGVRCTRSIKPP